jgi:hypothetical protein
MVDEGLSLPRHIRRARRAASSPSRGRPFNPKSAAVMLAA